jgi:hypothetical protein
MPAVHLVPDRRLPFAAVLADCLAAVLAFPVAAMLVAPEVVAAEEARAVLRALPWGLLLLNMIVFLFDPPEPPVRSVPRAVVAGIWRATLLFIGLLWVLVLSGQAAVVPVKLFVLAWGGLMMASAVSRTLRLLAARRIVL